MEVDRVMRMPFLDRTQRGARPWRTSPGLRRALMVGTSKRGHCGASDRHWSLGRDQKWQTACSAGGEAAVCVPFLASRNAKSPPQRAFERRSLAAWRLWPILPEAQEAETY